MSDWGEFRGHHIDLGERKQGRSYAHRGRRLEWVAYDELLASWGGEFGRSDPAGAYRRYVTAGLPEPPAPPWTKAHHGWALGGLDFAAGLRELVREDPPRERRRETRQLQGVDLRRVCEVVCRSYQIEPSEIGRRGSRHEARAALAYLARRHTAVPNSELAEVLGVSRPDCVPNLTRRFAAWLATRADVRRRLALLEDQLHRALAAAGVKPQTWHRRRTQSICGAPPPPCLHPACTDFGPRDLVACWHTLAADVRRKITELARGQRDLY